MNKETYEESCTKYQNVGELPDKPLRFTNNGFTLIYREWKCLWLLQPIKSTTKLL